MVELAGGGLKQSMGLPSLVLILVLLSAHVEGFSVLPACNFFLFFSCSAPEVISGKLLSLFYLIWVKVY